MHWAAAAGRDGMLESFIARAGPSCVNDRSFEGLTPLHAAAGHGHTGCVRILLRHAADPNLGMCEQVSAVLPQSAFSLSFLELIRNRQCISSDQQGSNHPFNPDNRC